MSETQVYRDFVKAFARKIAYLLCWLAIILVALSILGGTILLAVSIATAILSRFPFETSELDHLAMTMAVFASFVGLVGVGISAWIEASQKGDN